MSIDPFNRVSSDQALPGRIRSSGLDEAVRPEAPRSLWGSKLLQNLTPEQLRRNHGAAISAEESRESEISRRRKLAEDYEHRGRDREAAELYDTLLPMAAELVSESGDNRGMLADIYVSTIWPNYVLARYDKCLDSASRAIEVLTSQSVEDARILTRAYIWLTVLHTDIGSYELARGFSKKCLESGPDNPEVYRVAGYVSSVSGQWDEAVQFFQKSLQLAQEKDRKALQGVVLLNTAWLYIRQERYQEALEMCVESLQIREDLRHSHERLTAVVRGVAFCHSSIAEIYMAKRQWEWAKIGLLTALDLFSQVGDTKSAVEQYYHLALLSLEGDNSPEVALGYALRYREHFEASPFKVEAATAKRLVGRILMLLHRQDEGMLLLQESARELEPIGNKYELSLSYYELGLALWRAQDDRDVAASNLQMALAGFRELGLSRRAKEARQSLNALLAGRLNRNA